VELVNRAEARGLLRRLPGERDRRQVLLKVTPEGKRLLRLLSLHHREELRQAGPRLTRALEAVMRTSGEPVATQTLP
jgi:DNA-binding MarR family transcriptional regulator